MKTQPATDDRSKAASDLFPEGFGEWLHFAKHLTKTQKDILFDSLPSDERERLRVSRDKGGWTDVVMRDALSDIANYIEVEYGYNLLDIKCKVLKGKSVYLPRAVWDYVQFELQDYLDQHKYFLVSGIKGIVCKQNSDVVLLVRKDSNRQE